MSDAEREDNVAVITIDATADGPGQVLDDCGTALGLMLAMESANVLDDGQRAMVEEAVERLDQVAGEIGP